MSSVYNRLVAVTIIMTGVNFGHTRHACACRGTRSKDSMVTLHYATVTPIELAALRMFVERWIRALWSTGSW
jgi:hypothetical protein